MDFDEVTKLALESSFIFFKKVRYGQNFISCMVVMVTDQNYPGGHPIACSVEGMIKSLYMVTRIKYFKIFPSSYTCIVITPYFIS